MIVKFISYKEELNYFCFSIIKTATNEQLYGVQHVLLVEVAYSTVCSRDGQKFYFSARPGPLVLFSGPARPVIKFFILGPLRPVKIF